MTNPRDALHAGDALLLVDVQVDFCPGGALAIEQGDAVVPVLNLWIAAAVGADVPVYASRDSHPAQHLSFSESGGRWPPHCVHDSEGAKFHPDLNLPASVILVTKGVRFDKDQYSAFDDTGLATELRKRGIQRVWIGGLAHDVCVRATVLDARQEGFDTLVIADATRPVTRVGGEAATEDMWQAGAFFETTDLS